MDGPAPAAEVLPGHLPLPPRLLIESPTGVPVCLTVAGAGARAYAFFLDWLLRAALALCWYVTAASVRNGSLSLTAPLTPGPGWVIGVLAPAAALYFLYPPFAEIAGRGQTLGMRHAGVRVLSRDGRSPDLGALLIRNAFRLIDSLPAFYGVGLIATLCTRAQVRLGDMAAGTLLVYEPVVVGARARHLARGAAPARLARALALVRDYRRLAREVARARLSGGAARGLEERYAAVHGALQRAPLHVLPGLAQLAQEIPAVTRELTPHILWAGAVFVCSIAAGDFLVSTYPALIGLFASPQLIASVERGQLWTTGLLTVVPPGVLSLQLLTNNIVVSLTAYCAGFLLGLGTLYVVGLNGLTLGAVLAFTASHGLARALLSFMVAHGCVELSVMCLSGAAGAAVGAALLHPREASRLAAFRRAARQSGKLLLVCVALLVGCGLIEGYLSADPRFPSWLRLTVGLGYWLFMVALLTGGLTRGRRVVSPAQAADKSSSRRPGGAVTTGQPS